MKQIKLEETPGKTDFKTGRRKSQENNFILVIEEGKFSISLDSKRGRRKKTSLDCRVLKCHPIESLQTGTQTSCKLLLHLCVVSPEPSNSQLGHLWPFRWILETLFFPPWNHASRQHSLQRSQQCVSWPILMCLELNPSPISPCNQSFSFLHAVRWGTGPQKSQSCPLTHLWPLMFFGNAFSFPPLQSCRQSKLQKITALFTVVVYFGIYFLFSLQSWKSEDSLFVTIWCVSEIHVSLSLQKS